MSMTVYGAPWCEDTTELRRFLDERGVAYDWVDIDREEQAAAWVREQNGGKQITPTVKYGDRVLSNPNLGEMAGIVKELTGSGSGESKS